MLVGIYYSGQGGGDAAKAMATAARSAGHQARLRDAAAFRPDLLERFDLVVIPPGSQVLAEAYGRRAHVAEAADEAGLRIALQALEQGAAAPAPRVTADVRPITAPTKRRKA